MIKITLRNWASGFTIAVALFVVTGMMTISGCTDDSNQSGLTSALNTLADDHNRADDNKTDHSKDDNSKDDENPVPSSTGPWPKAVTQETNYDFNRMRLGSKKDYEFTIKNEGDAPLKLKTGDPTCKCTKFKLSATEIAPGESETLLIEWHGKFATKAFQHGGPVYTNDPERMTINFRVAGSVDAPAVALPEEKWDAGTMVSDEPQTFEGKLFSRIIPKMTIESLTALTEFTTAEYVPMTEDELKTNEALCGWNFQVTVRPDFNVGLLSDQLTVVVTELPEKIEIPVEARRLGQIRMNSMKGARFDSLSRRLDLGHFPAVKGRKAEVMLLVDQKNFKEELQLLDVESSPRSLKVSLEPIGKGTGVIARYRMTVEVPPGGLRHERMEENSATIRCRTNHPIEKEIQLKVAFNAF